MGHALSAKNLSMSNLEFRYRPAKGGHVSNEPHTRRCKVTALSAALALSLSLPAVSFAAPQTAGSSLLTPVLPQSSAPENRGRTRLKAVTDFASRTVPLMRSEVSRRYLENRRLGDISTFPYRLRARIEGNEWLASPFMPVPEKDLSCYYGIPSYRVPLEYDVNTTPVNISADSVYGSINGGVVYEGNVLLTQGDKTLKADKASYDHERGTVLSEGQIVYQGPEYTLSTGEPIESNLKTRITTLQNTDFQLNGSPARGGVGAMTIDNATEQSSISGLKFSTCPIGDEAWYVTASEVELVKGEAYGEAYDATVYVGDVPVFWTPYVNFPISSERKSGLLYPELSISSSNGFDYAQPIYFNIAPNFDDTLTPRIMTKRGVLLSNEFRYMTSEESTGTLTTDYIFQDNNWDLNEGKDSDERWMIDWYHESNFYSGDLKLIADYQKVRSDDYDYLSDFGSDNASVTDDNLMQSFRGAWNRESYDISLEVREYQSLVPPEASVIRPFAMMPQLKGAWYETYGKVLTRVDGEIVQFSDPSDGSYDDFNATRLHFEPSVGYQFFNSQGTVLSAGARGFLTHYEQDSLSKLPDYYHQELGFDELGNSVNRALYLLELKGKTTLERKVLDLRHTQTLEPEIAYRFIPYEDQSDIGLYDTTDRLSDFYSNYSWRRFTGTDRIADTNAITVGITSRLLDPHDREMLRFGISQTYSFVPTRVTLNPNDEASDYPRSPLAMTLDVSPIEEITAHGSVTYNNENNEISAWNFMTEYEDDKGYMFQVNYRYSRDGNRTLENRVIDLDQIGVQLKVPLFSDRLSFIAAAYRDLEQDHDIDNKFALRYEECCYAVTVMIEDYNRTDWDTMSAQSETRFGIQFEFKGLGAVNMSGGDNIDTTDTYLIDHFNPTNLNR